MRAHEFCAGISGEPEFIPIDTIRPAIDLRVPLTSARGRASSVRFRVTRVSTGGEDAKQPTAGQSGSPPAPSRLTRDPIWRSVLVVRGNQV